MSMRLAQTIALALGVLCASLWAESAVAADKRVALIVGNSAYQNAPALPNPARDARAVADKFKKAGYDVVDTAYDLGSLEFKRAIRQFEDAASDADIAVVYYAGHGIEIHGVNYVVPVDAKLASDRDADDEAIALDRLIESVDGAKKLRVIILDACRDNPFSRTMKQQRVASRGITSGLTVTEPTSINTLVAYAAKAGSQAEDGSADHSPFASALMDNLFVPGLDVRLAFGRVRDEVLKSTSNRQEPFVYGSLGGGNIALVSAPDQGTAAAGAVAASDPTGEKSDYSLVEKIGTKGAWQVFLTQHPQGFYAELAKAQISKLDTTIVVASADPSEGRNLESKPPAGPAVPQGAVVATLAPQKPSTPPGPSEEQRAWDKVKDSSNEADYKSFIKKYPTSVLADVAQSHINAIEAAAQEQAAKDAAKAQAAKDAALEAQRQAQIAEAKRQADEAARQKAAQEAALAAAQAASKAAAQAQADAEREAAAKHDEEAHQAALAALVKAKQQADAETAKLQAEQAAALAAAKQASLAAEKARLDAQRVAQAQQEATCKNEQDRLTSLQAQGSKARADLMQLQAGLTCDRLRPMVTAALDKANALPLVNTPTQITSAQQELARIGCYTGAVDGALTPTTTVAIQHYQAESGKHAGAVDISDAFISDLKSHASRVCPLVCPTGNVANGDKCVAVEKTTPVAHQEDSKPAPKKQTAVAKPPVQIHQAEEPRPEPPHAVEQAATGSGHSGHSSMIGVGF